MNKKLLSLAFFLIVAIAALAQKPLKTIQEVQFVSQQNLAAGNDASSFGLTDTIRIRGVVVMDAGLSTIVGGKQVWIQTNDGTPFSGIDVYQPFPSAGGDGGTGILTLVEGDSVEIVGHVEEFNGETEFVPNNTNPATPIQLLGSGITVKSKVVNVSDLNDINRNNILTTGEQWEGMYVEIKNVTVSSVDYFSNGARVSFNVIDAAGNKMNVSDRFKNFRLPATGGTFVPPVVGDFALSIKGVLLHSKNNRGYELHPIKPADVIWGASAPAISAISRNVNVPNNNDVVTISANITDLDGVASAKLYYAVGATNQSYISVNMTANGSSYTAQIPAQADGSLVKFFIEATDNATPALTSRIPNVPAEDPRFYVVRNNGLTIYDLQYTPFRSGNSGFVEQTVTVTGVVTSSKDDLGYVHIQQENQPTYAGITVANGTGIADVVTGDKVIVTGIVKEYFGLTRIENTTSILKVGTATIAPTSVNIDSFRVASSTATEPYESMLVKFSNSAGAIYINNTNADAPSNFAEYRVARDTLDPGAGCRVLAGRQTNSVFSSKNVSYVMDSIWTPNTGLPIIIVKKGDNMASLTGIMTYGFNNFKLLPRNNVDFEAYQSINSIGSSFVNKGKALVYPNPTSSVMNLDYIMPVNTADLTLKIYDIFGRTINAVSLDGTTGTANVNVSEYAQGTYIYSISSASAGVLNNGRFVVTK
jgi:predicted extracellular nuclease